MSKEIADLIELLGITELQAWRHVRARRELSSQSHHRSPVRLIRG